MFCIPIGLIAMWAQLLTGTRISTGQNYYMSCTILATLFVASRYLHTIFYTLAVQPWRSLAWLGSVLCILAMCGNCIYASFK